MIEKLLIRAIFFLFLLITLHFVFFLVIEILQYKDYPVESSTETSRRIIIS